MSLQCINYDTTEEIPDSTLDVCEPWRVSRSDVLERYAQVPVRARAELLPEPTPTMGRDRVVVSLRQERLLYMPPKELLFRVQEHESSECEPGPLDVIVPRLVETPIENGVRLLLDSNAPKQPVRSAPNLWHQVLMSLWTLESVPGMVAPDATAVECSCNGNELPPGVTASCTGQQGGDVPVETTEPPQLGPIGPAGPPCPSRCGVVASGEHAQPAEYIAKSPSTCEDNREAQLKIEEPTFKGKPGSQPECGCICKCVDPVGPVTPAEGVRDAFEQEQRQEEKPPVGFVICGGFVAWQPMQAVLGGGIPGQAATFAPIGGLSESVPCGNAGDGGAIGSQMDIGLAKPPESENLAAASDLGEVVIYAPDHSSARFSFLVSMEHPMARSGAV